MKTKNILVVDDSAAVQEMCRQVLTEGGHNVAVASNGVAALTYPDMDKVDLIIIDTHLRDVSGIDTTRQIKTDGELYEKPILLLVPEDKNRENESVELMGANSWLLKPFDPAVLLNKVNIILEEQEVLKQAREHLRKAAERTMSRLAEEQIQRAVEEKTQIMVERALQMVVSQVDSKARQEIDTKVNHLSAEKEQELVRVTVQEVARSTVDKLADKRVAEAMERILQIETEKTIRRAADEVFPALIRDRINESIDIILPKEVTRRVQKEAEEMVPEVSERVVNIINTAASKIVPRTARDIVTEQARTFVSAELDRNLSRLVQGMVNQEVDTIVRQHMEPYLRTQASRLRQRITLFMLLFLVLIGGCAAVLTLDYLFGPLIPRHNRPVATQTTPATSNNDKQPAESGETAPGSGSGDWLKNLKDKVGL